MTGPIDITPLIEARDRLRKRLGGGHDGGMPPPDLPERVAVLETHLVHVREDISSMRGDLRDLRQETRDIRRDMRVDFLITWGGMIATTLGLAWLIAKGFKWI